MKKTLKEFDNISNEIINKKEYKDKMNEEHHGINRYDHSLRVAKITYFLAKKFNLDYISATRAALLHDFFCNEDLGEINKIKKGKLHPEIAYLNAQKYYDLNNKEINVIKTHMFPLTIKAPNSLEGLVVNLADTYVAIYECSRFKLNTAFTVWMLFIFNLLTFSNN